MVCTYRAPNCSSGAESYRPVDGPRTLVYLDINLHQKLAEKHEFEFGGFGDVSVDFDSFNFVHGSQWFWSKICPESAKEVA